MHKRIGI